MENTEKLDPVVPIELAGKIYKVEFDMWAISQYYELTGINLLDASEKEKSDRAGQKEKKKSEPSDFYKFLWAGLITHQPELDGDFLEKGKVPESVRQGLRQCGKLCKLSDIPRISAALGEAVNRSKNSGGGEEKNAEGAEPPTA